MELTLACCCNREDCDEGSCLEYGDIVVDGLVTVSTWVATLPLTVLGIIGDIRIVLRKGQRALTYILGTNTWTNTNLTGLLAVQNLDGSPASGTASLGGIAVLTVSGDTATLVVTVSGTYDGDPVSTSHTWSKTADVNRLCLNKLLAPPDSEEKHACIAPSAGEGNCIACAVNPSPATYRVTLNLPHMLQDVTWPEDFPSLWMDCFQYYNREFLVYQESGCKWTSKEVQRPIGRSEFFSNFSRCVPDAGLVASLPRVQLTAAADFVDDVQVLKWTVIVRFAYNEIPSIGIPGYPVNVSLPLIAVVTSRDCTETATATGDAGSALIEVLT